MPVLVPRDAVKVQVPRAVHLDPMPVSSRVGVLPHHPRVGDARGHRAAAA
eukprot:CAMPEP_0181461832 /NCGR_PEP_ID=MMETSP1110-20121109/34078_1 /TAXON_ID=174948 /ORGANISM="Symbiodinium sp., Strain CCMP421" /LENGTH=49 /DNA_ID= /DNA_START= /DNA_END= /DNA_ORIENTATION=